MSVTTAFSAVIAKAIADWGKSPKSVFRMSADATVATAKMGDDTLELSTKTGNLTVRPNTGRAVAVIGIGSDGVLRIDCGGGPADLADEKLASAVKTVVEAIASAHRSAVDRGNRTSFTLAPSGNVGDRLYDELDGKSWHWLTTDAEIADDRKAMAHDFEAVDGECIVVSLRGPSGRRIGTGLFGPDGMIDYVSKTDMPSGLSGPAVIGLRLRHNPFDVDVSLQAGEWKDGAGIVVLDDRETVHNAFGPAQWSDDTWNGVIECFFKLDGKKVSSAEYPYAASASAAANDPSLEGDERESTITKWVARRLEVESERLEEQKNAGMLTVAANDPFFAVDSSNLFDRMARIATAETVERFCVFARFGVEKGDRELFVEGALAHGLLTADRADPAHLASIAKKAGAPASVTKALRAMDADEAKAAVQAVMKGKQSADWSELVPETKASIRRAA